MMRPGLFIFMVLSLLIQPVLAEQQNRMVCDSLQKVYHNTQDFKTKLEMGNEIVFMLRFDNKPLAKQIAKTLLSDKRIEQYPEGHARAWIRLGIVYDLTNMADSAIYCNEKALGIASQNQLPKQKASALNNMGLIYWNYNQLDKATDFITRASTEFEKIGDNMNLANALNNLGLIVNELTERQKGAMYHRKALALFSQIHDEYGIGSALHNLAFSQTQPDSGLYYYYKAIRQQKKSGDDYGLAKTYNNMAILYEWNYDSVQHYHDLAIEYHRKSGNLYGQASTLGTMANILQGRKQYERALAYALESERISKSIDYTKYLWKIEATLGNIYFETEQYKLAAMHFKLSVSAKDSALQLEKFNTSQQLEFKYNVAKKEKLLADQQADLAQKEKLIAQEKLEKKTILVSLMVIVFAAVVLLGILGWYFNRRRLRSQREHARQLAEERERSLQQNLMGQEEERQRIAKDLHDGIVQDLAAIKMNLEQIKELVPAERHEQFEQTRNSLEKTTHEVRSISHQMMPTALRELGLIAALEDNLQKVLGLHNIRHEFFSRGIEGRLPEKIEISLYRICQELINNVIKHSKATQVSISLTLINGFVTMHFEDNGKGFDVHKKSGGIGLTNLQSRVRIVNGEIRYETTEGSGTVAIIRVPV